MTETINATVQEERAPGQTELPLCPICGGFLVLLRTDFRCCQCGCSICESCEAPADDDR